MEKTNKKVLVLSLLMAAFLTFILYLLINKTTARTVANVNAVKIYVAGKDLLERQRITEQDVKEISTDPSLLSKNTLTRKEDIVGKYVQSKIFANEPFVSAKLVKTYEEAATLRIPAGKRAVSININELNSVSFAVKPGDKVDVLATFDKDNVPTMSPPDLQKITQIIIQNSEVLSMGIVSPTQANSAKETARTLSLAVTPQEAERLVFAESSGTLRMMLRPADDKSIVETQGAKRDQFKR